MGAFRMLLIISVLVQQIFAAPTPGEAQVSGSISGGIPPLLSFNDGNVGVNFLGFKASAGLGGLLTGDATQGGLHASAETPFGQRAGAGLGGRVDGNGRSTGGLYAGATAGGGVGASAGLDGAAGAEGSVGRSYAGASAGGVSKTVIKEKVGGVPAAGASFSGSLNIQKIAAPVEVEIVKEVAAPPPLHSRVDIEVVKEKPAPPPPAVKTYVERTVIPNYVEKTIQVPSYVEKTIRVPTTIEKKVRVAAAPTIIEKEIEVPVQPVVKTKEVFIQNEDVPIPPATTYFTKTKYYRRPWSHHHRKRISYSHAPYYGGVVASGTADVNSNAGVNAVADSGAYAGGFGSFGYGYEPGYYGNQGSVTVRKQFNGNLIRDIFNIPIATLGAVSNLVGGIAGGTSGSVSVSKSYGTYRK